MIIAKAIMLLIGIAIMILLAAFVTWSEWLARLPEDRRFPYTAAIFLVVWFVQLSLTLTTAKLFAAG